jgi:hypothetical protein
VTLVEMLVTVAVLVIIMTIMVQIFQSATGAVSTAQAIQELDNSLRLLDATIRADLAGVTARFTPPLDPAAGLGYFEYGENEFADSQGEDSDDYIRFTAKAPAGRPFTGRMWVSNPAAAPGFYNANVQPVTVTSEYAEIIYFLRNGNLYRRVLLIAPELQSAIVPTLNNTGYFYDATGQPTVATAFQPGGLGGATVSWQGVNDLSARPNATGPNSNLGLSAGQQAAQTIILNTLGDLTNRENRFAYPRFANDFWNLVTGAAGTDGFADDLNGDNVPDYYPSLYPGAFNPANPNAMSWQLIFEPGFPNVPRAAGGSNTMGFPWVFRGAYSKAQVLSTDAYGWIHAPAPYANVSGQNVQFDGNGTVSYNGNQIPVPLAYLLTLNHNPLDVGDNLPTPINPTSANGPALLQTWWGFPTWRETLSPLWNDPTVQVNVNGPPNGLLPLSSPEVAQGSVNNIAQLLPDMTGAWRNTPQLFTDGYGGNSQFFLAPPASNPALWTSLSWEDDLIMTGVRSFDVKAYDNAYAGYSDLGWGDDLRLYLPYQNLPGYIGPPSLTFPPGLNATPPVTVWPPVNPQADPTAGLFSTINQTFAHEGRMPPLVEDLRVDAQYGAATYPFPAGNTYTGNVGDDNAGVVRLRRVWDSWSTEYSRAPATGVYGNGFPAGPPFSPPIYPSYPPPYPAPLRGIQIQIRVVDPTNQRVKSLTIRQDFTDKL